MTILGDTLGRRGRNRMTQLLVLEDGSRQDNLQRHPHFSMDDADMDYLRRKGALNCPPPHVWYVAQCSRLHLSEWY